MRSAIKVAGGQRVWTREAVERHLNDYTDLYGPNWTASAFSPSTAKWRDEPDLIERYYAGNPRTGTAWPSLNTIKGFFDGSFNGAREALGLPRNTPGPASKRRAPGTAAPQRDVRERVHRVVVERVADNRRPGESLSSDGRVRTVVERVVERVEVPAPGDKKLRRQVERAEARLATSTERLRETRARLREATLAAKARDRADGDTRGRLRREMDARVSAEANVVALRAALAELEASWQRTAEEQEADVIRVEAERDAARARAAELEGVVELVDRDELARAAKEVEGARARVADALAAKTEAERVAGAARRDARAATVRAEKAERRAAAERAMRARLQETLVGHTRRLTPGEVEALRERGPAGPAIFGDAVRAVVNAQAKGERAALQEALRRAASAAVGWRERL